MSAVPNVVIAHSLTGPGVRSMTADPTAVRESDSGPTTRPTSWVTPSATAAAAIPAIARGPLRAAMQAKVPIRLTRKPYRKVTSARLLYESSTFWKGSQMEIAGKKAIIVGGASGFGKATAEALAKRGASVAILDRPQSKGKEVADAIGGTFHEVDVTDFDGTEQVLQEAIDALGGLHIAVTTAGGGIGERTIKQGRPAQPGLLPQAASTSTSSAPSTSAGWPPGR